MDSANVFHAEFEYDETDPQGYRAAVAAVGKTLGGEETAIKAFELPPNERICPYHYEYVEEWLLVLEGNVVVRTPDGEQELRRGDLMRFASGPSGAHQVSNRADRAARVLMLSSSREPAVAIYPDSDKIGVWPGSDTDRVMLRRSDGNVDYYDGER